MGQVTTGVRSFLSVPAVYDTVQAAFGAKASRATIVADFLKASPGDRVLDIGCGTGEILPHLPDGIEYWGFDLSPEYIEAAKARHGTRGRFECADVGDFLSRNAVQTADLVLAAGVVHHLDPEPAADLFKIAWLALRPGGRLVTVDPTFAGGQSRASRWLVSKDRGQSVLGPEGYRSLASSRFRDVQVTTRHDLLRIPYSHCILVCTKSEERAS